MKASTPACLALSARARVYEAARNVGGAATLVLGENGALDQRADEPRLVHQVLGRDLIPRRKNPLRRRYPHAAMPRPCHDPLIIRRR